MRSSNDFRLTPVSSGMLGAPLSFLALCGLGFFALQSQRHFTYAVNLRNNSSQDVDAQLIAAHGKSVISPVSTHSTELIGVFLRNNEAGVIEVSIRGKVLSRIVVEATDEFNGETTVDYP